MLEGQTTFAFISTEDSSPTVRLGPLNATSDQLGEAMHSLKGAFSETVYIYGTAISTLFEKRFLPRVLSLGLGLGYVEILAAGLCLKAAKDLPAQEAEKLMDSFGGESFELVPELRKWFTGWALNDQSLRSGTASDFYRAYDEILERTSRETGIDSSTLTNFITKLIQSGRWRIREALTHETRFDGTFGCICFDAFSSKTSPDLWTEPFLLDFFARSCAPGCVLSTYACTGALKRSLRASGFDLNIREGFASKRDSTFAVRKKEIESSSKNVST